MKKIVFIYLLLILKTAHSFANVGFYGPVLAPPDPTVTGITTICVLNSTTLTASIPPPTTNIVYRWFNTSSPLEVVPIYTGASYTTPALLTSRSYFVESYNTVTLENSSRTQVDITVIVANADVPIGTPAESVLCSGDSTTIAASSLVGATTFRWYTALTGGTLLHTGSVYQTGPLTNSTIYYLESETCVGLFSARTPVSITVLTNNDIVTGTPANTTLCAGDSTTITGTSILGNTIFNWYNVATGGVPLYTGNPYRVGNLSSNTVYYVQTVNANGCYSARFPVPLITSLPVLNPPTVTPAAAIICSGQSTSFTANSISGGSVTYRWYDALTGGTLLYTGQTFNTGPVTNNGAANALITYYAEIQDGTGCLSGRTPVVLTIRPAVAAGTVNPVSTTVCSGASVLFTGSTLLGSIAQYDWYDALTGGILLHSGIIYNTGPVNNGGATNLTQNYYLELVDTAGCKSVRTAGTVIIRPALSVPVVDPLTTTICSGDSVTFTASNALNTPGTYRWYDALTGGTLLHTGSTYTTGVLLNNGTVDLTRAYFVDFEDGSACLSLRAGGTVVIRPVLDVPVVNPPATTVCADVPITFTASSALGTGATYRWYDASSGGTLLYTGNPYTADPITNTGATNLTRIFYVSLTDTNGCVSTRTPATAIVTPAVDAPLVSPAASQVCSGGSATFTASSLLGTGVSYKWYDAANAGTLVFTGNPFNTGAVTNTGITNLTQTYYAELTDANGCVSTRTPGSLVITPAVDAAIVNPPTAQVCSGGSVAFMASSTLGTGASYNWYDALTAGTLLFSGNPFTTGPITNGGASNLTKTYYVEITDSNGCLGVRTPAVVIITPAVDAPIVSPPTDQICAGGSEIFTASSALGSGVTYKWYDDITAGTLLFTGNPYNTGPVVNGGTTNLTRTYYSELTDANGCVSLRTPATLVVTPLLDAATVTPPVAQTCSGGSVTFTANSLLGNNVSYNWYDAPTGGTLLYTGNPYSTDTINNTGATDLTRTYYVELVDTAGCKSLRTSAMVIIRPILDVPVVNPPTSVICTGHSVTLTATSLLGTAVTYNWYDTINAGTLLYTGNPYTTDSINNSGSTDLMRTYYVELVDTNGCKSVRTPAAVIIRPTLDVPVVVPPAAVTCSGNAVTLTATSVLGTAASYNWYNALTGGTLLYTGNPYTTDTINNTSTTDLTRTYFVELVDTAGCVSVRTPVAVVIRPALDVPLVNPLASLICSGDSLTLTASSLLGTAVSYSWYDSISAGSLLYTGNPYHTGPIVNSAAVNLARMYYVELTDTGGCRSLRTSAAVVIRPALDVPIVDPLASVICAGDSLTLTASSLLGTAVQYNWYTDLTGDSIVYTGNPYRTGAINNTSALDLARTYFVELVDTSGCRSLRSPSAVIIRPALDVPLVNPLTSLICSGDSLTLTASSLLGSAVRYNWYRDLAGDSILFTGNPYSTGPIVNSSALDLARTYFVELVDTMGCRSLRTLAAVIIRPALDVPLVDPLASLICSGDSLTLTASSLLGTAVHYNWYTDLLGDSILYTGNPYLTDTIINSSAVDLTRTYFVELVDTNGCKSIRTPSAVVIRPALDAPLVNPLASLICSGDSLTLTASSLLGTATYYNWYTDLLSDSVVFTGNPYQTGAINNTSAVDLARTYYVELVDTIGCRSIRTPSAVVIRPALDIPIVNPLVSTICSGDSVQLHASSLLGTAVQFNWYDTLVAGNVLHQGDTFNTGGLYQPTIFYVELEDNAGCKSVRTPSVVVVNVNSDQPNLQADNSTICVGATTQILASSLASAAYNWFLILKGGQPIFTGTAYETPPLTGTTTYYVEGVNTLGCKSIRTLITILTTADDSLGAPDPRVKNRTNKSITFVWDSVRLAKSYEISTDDGKTWSSPSSATNGLTHTYVRSASDKGEIMFQVRAVTDSICIDQSGATSRRLAASFSEVGDLEVFYNAFSPNGDGVNDNWMVTDGLEKFPDNTVMIFDRWGKEIYNQIGYDYQDSDRSFSGKGLDDGTYFYVLKIPSIKFEKSGYVMIIR